jgi:hypothetical protein
MTDLICPFKFMTSSVVRDCIRSKCALWIEKTELLGAVAPMTHAVPVLKITEGHCSLNTSPKILERLQ